MKVISLNIWGGRLKGSLLSFLKSHGDVDIFLFQEVCENGSKDDEEVAEPYIFSEVAEVLSGYKSIFVKADESGWGLAAFVRNGIEVKEAGDIFITQYRKGDVVGKKRNLQHVSIEESGRQVALFNYHGLWTGGGKEDSEERLEQSRKIVDFIKGFSGEIILSGDFNLLPETRSLKMLEDELGLENLIKKFNIVSTRTSHYERDVKFADYMLVSKGVEVKEFKVLPEEVSDHAAMYLEFDIMSS
jgi:endonuclease/exonuclease/phosphatase family metal-dependent hydrolase